MATKKNKASATMTTETTADSGVAALVPVDDLKSRFRAGTVPLEGDYAALIDMAAAGATAVGAASESPGAGQGLKLNENKLEVDLADNSLQFAGGALRVSPGNGIEAGAYPVRVKPKEDGGIAVDANGVGVKADAGIKVDSNGISVSNGVGLDFDLDKRLKVRVFQGLRADQNGTSIRLSSMISSHTASGLHGYDATPFSFSGRSAEDLGGLDLHIHTPHFRTDPTPSNPSQRMLCLQHPFTSGMILMFRGEVPPKNWVLCDGENDTPDLRAQFIKDEKLSTKEHPRYSVTYIMLKDEEENPA